MSSESDGSGRPDDIVIIKQLLQKLEQAAARDTQTSNNETSNNETPSEEPPLLVLRSNRSGGPASLRQSADGLPGRSQGMPEFSRVPIAIDFATAEPAPVTAPHRPGIAVAALSFVLGIAAAGGLIVAFDPFGQRGGGSVIARAPPAASAPAVAPSDGAAARVSPDAGEVARAGKPEPIRQETVGARVPESAEAPVAQPAPAKELASDASGDKIGLRVAARIELRAGERRSIEVRIDAPAGEAQRLLVVFRQVPAWITFSKGGAIGNDIWLLPAQQVRDLEVEVNEGADGAADVKVQLAKVDGSILAETGVSFVASSPLPPAVTAGVATGGNEATILRLQARGELLLDTGEVEAARTLLRTAAEAGSVVAALRLAETYDPGEIQRLGMAERSADLGMAVRWYEHAHALGSPVAAARLVALGRR